MKENTPYSFSFKNKKENIFFSF